MAGRPIRRAREVARANPLVGYINDGELKAAEVYPPYAPLLHARAQQIFEAEYARVVPNIIVYFGPFSDDIIKTLKTLAREESATVLAVRESRKDGTPFYARAKQQKGQPFRLTPFTAFTLLHRAGDELYLEAIKKRRENTNTYTGTLLSQLDQRLGRAEDKCRQLANDAEARGDLTEADRLRALAAELGTSGVNTAAGRKKLLTGMDQVFADLFAKYLMTGKVAYSYAPTGIEEVDSYYRHMTTYIPRILARMLAIMRETPILFLSDRLMELR
jgi:hypothetical protein